MYICTCACSDLLMHTWIQVCIDVCMKEGMGWLRLVGSLKLHVSFAKEPYKRDYILQKRPIILRSLLIQATPYLLVCQGRHSCHPSSMTGNVVRCSMLQYPSKKQKKGRHSCHPSSMTGNVVRCSMLQYPSKKQKNKGDTHAIRHR